MRWSFIKNCHPIESFITSQASVGPLSILHQEICLWLPPSPVGHAAPSWPDHLTTLPPPQHLHSAPWCFHGAHISPLPERGRERKRERERNINTRAKQTPTQPIPGIKHISWANVLTWIWTWNICGAGQHLANWAMGARANDLWSFSILQNKLWREFGENGAWTGRPSLLLVLKLIKGPTTLSNLHPELAN